MIFAFVASVSITATAQQFSLLNEQKVLQFCEEKPIWSGFGIPVKDCVKATRECSMEKRFLEINPSILSEEFYNCVFKKLDFEVN